MDSRRNRPEIICRCNNVDRATIEKAIRNGAHTMNEIFDSTTAGIGPCGGSCRRKLQPMLEFYLANGKFPEKIIEDRTGKVDPAKPAAASESELPPTGTDAVKKSSSDDNR